MGAASVSRAVTTTMSSVALERTVCVPNSRLMSGMSLRNGTPASTASLWSRYSPAITIDSPLPTSTVVSARRTLMTGISIPTTVSESVSERCDTSGRTVSTIRPLSTIVGTKSSSTPYFLYSKMIAPSSKPAGSGYSPPEKKLAVSPETAVTLGRASTVARPAVARASIRPRTVVGPPVLPNTLAACPPGKAAAMNPAASSKKKRPTRKPRLPPPPMLGSTSQLKPSVSLTLRCTSAICTSRLTCWVPETLMRFSIGISSGRALVVSRRARSASAIDTTVPLSSTPLLSWRTVTSLSAATPLSAARTGSTSITVEIVHSPISLLSASSAATEVRPTALPTTNSTPDETSCTLAISGLATKTEATGVSSRKRRL